MNKSISPEAWDQIQSYDESIFYHIKEAQRCKTFTRILVVASCAVIGIYIYIFYLTTHIKSPSLSIQALLFGIFLVFLFIGLFFYGRYGEHKRAIFRTDYVRESFMEFNLGLKKKMGYFDRLVKINLDNLNDYYELVQANTRKSFNLSAAIGVIGFLIIIISLILGYVKEEFKDISYITAGAGVIVEMISSIFFYLYNKTVRQLKEYHDSLLGVQNILLSFKLVNEDIKQDEKKSPIIEKMVEYLIGREPFGISQTQKSKIKEIVDKAKKVIK